MERPNAWKTYKKADLKKVEQTAAEYRRFLDNGKTERECAKETIEMLEKAGYVSLQSAIDAGKKLKPGDKVYLNQMGKAVLIFLMGKKPLPHLVRPGHGGAPGRLLFREGLETRL